MRAWLAVGLLAAVLVLLLLNQYTHDRDSQAVGIAACLFLVVAVLRLTKGVET